MFPQARPTTPAGVENRGQHRRRRGLSVRPRHDEPFTGCAEVPAVVDAPGELDVSPDGNPVTGGGCKDRCIRPKARTGDYEPVLGDRIRGILDRGGGHHVRAELRAALREVQGRIGNRHDSTEGDERFDGRLTGHPPTGDQHSRTAEPGQVVLGIR